jgi:hypothetical protein
LTGDALVFILRFAFVLLLYLFLFSLVAAIRRDLSRAAHAGVAEPDREVAPEGRLIVVRGDSGGPESGRSLPLAPVTVIGRAPGCQIRLDDAFVSAEHARLRRRNGRWYVADLQSTNGTLLNQRPLEAEQPIEYGDVIGIGDVRLKLAR